MRASAALALVVFALPVAACDSGDPGDPTPFDPSTVDYNEIGSLDFGDYVQPLLAARDVFATGEAASDGVAGSLSDYTWSAIFDGEAGETIVPFDEEGSFLIRFVKDLPADATIPYPNLRTLEEDELLYLKRWIDAGARNDEGVIPYADADPMHVLYTCEQGQGQNSVALVDMERRRIIRRIYFDELGVPSGQYGPHHVVFEPDLSAWYVSLVNGGVGANDREGRIVKLSTSLTMDPGDLAYRLALSPSFRTPGMMAIDPSTDRLWVGRSTLSQAGTPNIGIFTRSTMTLEDEVTTPFDVPHALAISEDGAYVLTASLSGNQMASIRTADLEVQLMPLAGGAHELIHFAVHPATHTAEAAGGEHAGHDMSHGASAAPQHIGEVTLTSRSSDEVLFFRLNEDGTLTADGTVAVGDGPYHAHLGHDGHTLLVPNQFGNSLSLVDINTRAVTNVANPAGGPFARPHTPTPGLDGTTFWVTNSNTQGTWAPVYRFLGPAGDGGTRTPQENIAFGNIALFDTSGALLKLIQLGPYPSGVEHPMHHDHAGMQGGHEGHEGHGM